jgi:hypothetical protein
MNGGEVSALTTRGDLIAAASTSGEVALWNYEGLKIATVEVKGSSIRDLSIRDTNLLVVSNGDAYEFNLPMPTNANTIPSVLKLKKGGHHNLGQATWAAYDPEGKNILLERKTDVGNHTLQRFRPVLPLSSKDYDIYILSYREKREGFGQQNIVIERFDSGKTSIVREFQVDYIPIKSLWCDRERLYWIYRFGSRIRMVNLTDGLNFETNSTVQLAECFSLTYPNNR